MCVLLLSKAADQTFFLPESSAEDVLSSKSLLIGSNSAHVKQTAVFAADTTRGCGVVKDVPASVMEEVVHTDSF